MAQLQAKDDGRIDAARALVDALLAGDDATADRLLESLSQARESSLFQEFGKLTRQLHDTLNSFGLDEKIADLTQRDIPDAKERLNYVIAMTEQSANTTLNAVESLLPETDRLLARTADLSAQWARFRQREMPVEEFRRLTQTLSDHFAQTQTYLDDSQNRLNEVLMAQSFQDLTSQIIRRVIQLVHDLEVSMVEIIRISGSRRTSEAEVAAPTATEPCGPCVPGLDQNAVHNQDDVDALLSSLGF